MKHFSSIGCSTNRSYGWCHDFLSMIRFRLTEDGLVPGQLIRIGIQIPSSQLNNLHDWLNIQRFDEKFFWSSRNSEFQLAGVGVARAYKGDNREQLFRSLKDLKSDLNYWNDDGLKILGGCRFNLTTEVERCWQPFAGYNFILPLFTLETQNNSYYFNCNILYQGGKESLLKKIESQFSHLIFTQIPEEELNLSISQKKDVPSRMEFCQQVEKALDLFQSDEMEKLVLARKTVVDLEKDQPGVSLLKHLPCDKNAYQFYFQPEKKAAFLGITPERLFFKRDRTLWTEAVAGTRVRGADVLHDQQLGQGLLDSSKDNYEHQLVVQSIHAALNPLSHSVHTDKKPRLLKLKKLQHLHVSAKAELRDGIDDFDLMDALHPTAAVGGYPLNKAFTYIEGIESLDRGWYAGPIGWISKSESEFAVAIRSALIEQNKIHVFAGAGIVEGSVPDSEWQEIENKMANFHQFMDEESIQ